MLGDRINVLLYNPERTAAYVKLLSHREAEMTLFVCESESDIVRAIAEADVLFVSARFPSKYLRDARRAKWIQVMGAGVERFAAGVDLPPGILLTRVNVGFGERIAEHVLGCMLARSQRLGEVLANQQLHRWEPLDCRWLHGETLGVAGLGVIGRAIARRARSFDMHVVGLDMNPVQDDSVERVYGREQLMDFVAGLDYLSINMPLTVSTTELFDGKVFQRMKQGAVVINTARGGLVREPDLIDALKRGHLGGAILDVFATEPLPADNPLWSMKNVIVTPHHSGPSIPEEMTAFFLDNLERARQGKPMRGIVDQTKQF